MQQPNKIITILALPDVTIGDKFVSLAVLVPKDGEYSYSKSKGLE